MQDKELLTQLFSGESSQAAWKEFLLRYSNLFPKIIWLCLLGAAAGGIGSGPATFLQ